MRYTPGKAETGGGILKISNSLRFPSEALQVIRKHSQASFHGAELQAKLPDFTGGSRGTGGKVRLWFWVIKTRGTLVSKDGPRTSLGCSELCHATAPQLLHCLWPLGAHLSHR